MRDLIILAIVIAGAAVALWRPWIGILLWTWVSLMNPHRYAWGIAYDAPVAAIAAVSVLIGTLFTKYRQSPFQGAPTLILFLFAIWMTISWLAGYDTAGDYPQWDKVIKIYLMTFVALMLLNHKQKIIAFAWVTALSLALLGAKGGLFTLLTAGNYRVWGPPGSFVADNNHFALALIMTIPLLHFLQLQLHSAWQRHLVTAIMVLCAISAIGSYSRGALLAIAAMTALLWWRSERKLLLGMLIILMVAVFLPFMPETWWERMRTIQTYEQDASAMGRINAWIVAWEVAKNHFFGGGMSYQHPFYFMQYGVYEDIARAAHSIYFQILGNHGFVGLMLYLLIWLTTYRSAGWLREEGTKIPQAKWVSDLGAMAQVSFVGFAVGGAFLSLPYFDLPYNLMVMVVLARKWVEKRAWETEKDVTLWEMLSFRRNKPVVVAHR
ncbi:MAG: putative O-glycosylation ligase, exosortase A system-associated [Pseudomonadota bacterium]|uniref:putative O-glycosylation ligase, exosortase A system-associated n=1 Tax=Sulfuricystis thermophila TaxID=2496847 RepID=UPI0010364CDF|nr:putative O-glycosylation ligase, exosortase A system-associated [Sulfuricystis thermophila]